ncbi:hypothetical protein [Dactylosporangium sp. CA-233914]|uniref:hypothetical protein n=1 Tax=Dactylosporangium sp. CA-233914 TaxID=3239934 RepID=UPI003D8B1A29
MAEAIGVGAGRFDAFCAGPVEHLGLGEVRRVAHREPDGPRLPAPFDGWRAVLLGPVDADVEHGCGWVGVGGEPRPARLLLQMVRARGDATVADKALVGEDLPWGSAVGDNDRGNAEA